MIKSYPKLTNGVIILNVYSLLNAGCKMGEEYAEPVLKAIDEFMEMPV